MNRGISDSEQPQCDSLASSLSILIKDKQLNTASCLKEVALCIVDVSIKLQEINLVFSARKGLSQAETSVLSPLPNYHSVHWRGVSASECVF